MQLHRFELPGPMDLGQTLRPLKAGGTFKSRLDDGRHCVSLCTPAGGATVALRVQGAHLEAEAWGEGAEWALLRVPRLLGFDDGSGDFVVPPSPLRDLYSRGRGLFLGSTGLAFAALVPTVLGQKVTSEEAHRSLRGLLNRLGDDAPGPVRTKILPPADRVASLAYEDLHPLGVERRRAMTVIEVARRARRLEEAMTMAADDARKRLGSISGVGPWTVETVMGVGYGDRDAVPIGDYHLPNDIAWVLAGESRADDERMLQLLEPYRPHRRRVVLLVKGSGMHAPRYGPKAAIRSIEGI